MSFRSRWVDAYRSAKAPAYRHVALHWNAPMFSGLAALARSYLRAWGNNSYDLSANGELRVLERLDISPSPTVFDVGANRGDWTEAVLAHNADAAVECFEPTSAVYHDLESRYSSDERVRTHRVALSDSNGTGRLAFGADDSKNTLSPIGPGASTYGEEVVQLERGDHFMAMHGLESIDLLKIDTEGHDLSVLRGFGSAIEHGRVAAIQFEYNSLSIDSRALLADYYEYLVPLGYHIGKIHPNGVDFKDYDYADENWIGPNCLAVHETRPDLRIPVGLDPSE